MGCAVRLVRPPGYPIHPATRLQRRRLALRCQDCRSLCGEGEERSMSEISELEELLSLVEADETDTPPFWLDDCIEALREELPGFWWRGGTCALSSEVIIAADYNCPEHGE